MPFTQKGQVKFPGLYHQCLSDCQQWLRASSDTYVCVCVCVCVCVYVDTNLQKIHKTSFKYNKFYTNKLKLQQVLH